MYFLPIRLCYNVYTYPNPKPTPYKNENIVIIVVQCDKKYAVLMCACMPSCAIRISSSLKGVVSDFWQLSRPL